MVQSARRFRVGASTFDLGTGTVVVGAVAWAGDARLGVRLDAAAAAGVDIVVVTGVPSAEPGLGAAVARIKHRTELPAVVEVTNAEGISIALDSGLAGVAVLSVSEPTRTRRLAALALGVGRGWPVVRIDLASRPDGGDDAEELAAAVRVIRMIDAIRAAAADCWTGETT